MPITPTVNPDGISSLLPMISLIFIIGGILLTFFSTPVLKNLVENKIIKENENIEEAEEPSVNLRREIIDFDLEKFFKN